MSNFLNFRDASPIVKSALKNMWEVLDSEGNDTLKRIYAQVAHQSIYQYMEEKGYKRSSRADIRRLITGIEKKWHIPWYAPGDDHCSLWNKDGRAAVYLSQPYHLTMKDVQEMLEFAQKYELKFFINTYPDFHFPGSVLVVWWERINPFPPKKINKSKETIHRGVVKVTKDKNLNQAIERGYVITGKNYQIANPYYHYCMDKKKPYLRISIYGKKCSVRLDLDWAEYHLTEVQKDKIEHLLDWYYACLWRYVKRMNYWHSIGQGGFDVSGIPAQDGPMIADEILKIIS